jgi:hypothetical protein
MQVGSAEPMVSQFMHIVREGVNQSV